MMMKGVVLAVVATVVVIVSNRIQGLMDLVGEFKVSKFLYISLLSVF